MLDSIHVGVTGLLAQQQGLRVIANNTANMNTPGFKSSNLQFADLFYSGNADATRSGHGVTTTGTRLDFRQGELRQTGADFDLAVNGEGLFMLRDGQGQVRYTRAGQFAFDADGAFVHQGDGSKVLGFDDAGKLVALSLDGQRISSGQPTASARFTGNLSSTQTEQTVNGVKVFDTRGGEHLLSLRFTNMSSQSPGTWKLELLDGANSVGTADLVFADGRPTAATSKLTLSYTPSGQSPQALLLDFSSDVTSFASGDLSTLAMTSQDGYAPGNLAKLTFDAAGTLVATYTNGHTSKGARLALARFPSTDAVEELGGNLFGAAGGVPWLEGRAGEGGFGSIKSGMLEMSNVDLSREFSDLVVMQRGYQAASQVISTANDMLQELFGMRHK
jgi:flagellar hook protein FlgE